MRNQLRLIGSLMFTLDFTLQTLAALLSADGYDVLMTDGCEDE